jgi:hypothetical protein
MRSANLSVLAIGRSRLMQFANRQVLAEATGATECHGCKVPSLSVQSYPWVKAPVLEVFPYNFLSFLSEASLSQPLKTFTVSE